jgi:hypothetical protein
MNMSQLAFFRLEEHLDNNPIKTTNLRHIIRLFQNAKLHIIFQSSRKMTKKESLPWWQGLSFGCYRWWE